tara:strand:- start:3458 stop:3724 length:267 start_codon:yes stop_codon:yes gene_type:complete
MFKSIQESIDRYIEKQQLTEVLIKEAILKEIYFFLKKTKQNQILNISIKGKAAFIKTASSELKQEILLNKKNILKNLKSKKIDLINIK